MPSPVEQRSRLGAWAVAALAAAGCTKPVVTPSVEESRTLPAQPGGQQTAPAPPASVAAPAEANEPDTVEAGTAGAMQMKSLVSHGYGCGGHCAFNWRGQSSVEIVWDPDGRARLSDEGTSEESRADPDGYSTTRRTWSYRWVGTWSGDALHRAVDAQRITSMCNVSADGRNHDTKATCPSAPQDLRLACEWGPIPEGSRSGRQQEASAGLAWICRMDPSQDGYLGTDVPWVFAQGTLERRTMGEPVPEVRYEPWVEAGGAPPGEK